MPSVHVFVGDYGPFQPKGPIDRALLWLCHGGGRGVVGAPACDGGDSPSGRHALYSLAGAAQAELLRPGRESDDGGRPRFSRILIVDLADAFATEEEYRAALAAENARPELTKALGKKLLRTLKRLVLTDARAAAEGELAGVLLKLYAETRRNAVSADMIEELWLMHPDLSEEYVAAHLSDEVEPHPAQLNLVRREGSTGGRLPALRRRFPDVATRIVTRGDAVHNAFSVVARRRLTDAPAPYAADRHDDLGHSLFLSRLHVEMDVFTKQYQRRGEDVTADLDALIEAPASASPGPIDWSRCDRHVSALVLRGNRCVLARSLAGACTGMRIPSVLPRLGEAAPRAALRALEEHTGVEEDEVRALEHFPVLTVYAPNGRAVLMELHVLYAVNPPPEGPLEEADMEDEEDDYDWYTYPNAVRRLDAASGGALRTVACALSQAAAAGLVPDQWGGVFGKELRMTAK